MLQVRTAGLFDAPSNCGASASPLAAAGVHKGNAGAHVPYKAVQEATSARLVGQLGQEAVKVLRDLVCLVRGARFRGDARPPCCPMQPMCALVLRERSHT